MKSRQLPALMLAALLALPAAAPASEVQVGGTLYSVPMRTMMDLRFQNVVHQTQDLSCGAAAVATLLRYYYGEDITERQAIDAMMALGDDRKILKDGFSMLELKRLGEARGYKVGGFRLEDAQSLKKLEVPVITLVRSRGYSHFVVIKGIVGDTVYIADPAYGNRTRRLETFEPDWNHVVLAFLSETRSGDNRFAYDAMLKAPARRTMTILEQSITTHVPGAGEF